MTFDASKYVGWHLAGVSLDNQLFTINLTRHTLPATAAANLAAQLSTARIVFVADKVVLSNISGGAEVKNFEQFVEEAGVVRCVVKLSTDSFIEVHAKQICDFAF
jgi:hypothetical protein